jgi:S-adenosylmethionine decarboxylase proenzyme
MSNNNNIGLKSQRIFDFNLKQKTDNVWDESIPIIHHTVVEAIVSNSENLDKTKLSEIFTVFCENMNLHQVESFFHEFEPHGISFLVVLEESHLAIHTWPEKCYMHIDMVTCTKEETKLLKILENLELLFGEIDARIINLKY